MPEHGSSAESVIARMSAMQEREVGKWKGGFVSGAVYHGGDDVLALQGKVFAMYNVANPLHAGLWPSVTKYEAEVLSMAADLVNGGDVGVCGTMTSGGTESIFMAIKTHREYARRELGITHPELVAPITAHASVDKACEILGIRLVHTAVDPVTCKADVRSIKQALSRDTIMIYCSAPQFPHGIIDPVEELSEIAAEHGCGLHVDCCLGGFVLPFARRLGIPGIPRFDFALPGVTSMSMDTHKYGYSPKGTSVVLYRSSGLRRFQYFTFKNWPGGLYATPGLPGSRAGSLVAATWATMVSLGEEGYLRNTRQILDAAQRIRSAIQDIDGLKVMGDPVAMIVAFTSDKFNIYELADLLTQRGYDLNVLQRPACVHICVTMPIVPVVDRFIKDIQECSSELRSKGGSSRAGSWAPLYGMASALPAGPLEDVLASYFDVVYEV